MRNVTDEVFCLVKRLEAVVRLIKYTPDGEVLICEKDKVHFPLPLDVDELIIEAIGFKPNHHKAMQVVYNLVQEIHGQKREVPPTRDELCRRGVTRKEINRLCHWGFLNSALLPMHDQETKKMIGARTCVYFTSQGRAYVRKHIDPDYATAGRAAYESVREEARARYLARLGNSAPA